MIDKIFISLIINIILIFIAIHIGYKDKIKTKFIVLSLVFIVSMLLGIWAKVESFKVG